MSNSTYIIDDKLLVSGGQRFLNYLLDMICVFLSIIVLGFFIAFFATVFGFEGLLLWLDNVSDLEGRLVFIVVTIFYYTLTEGLFGRSLA